LDRRLERAWASSAETCADIYATNGKAERSLDLASAILKLAREVPATSTASLPIAAHFVMHQLGEVSSRVRQLAEGDNLQTSSTIANLRMAVSTFVLLLGGSTMLSALHLADENLSHVTHQMIETLVRLAK
jgi:hypothetical protein